jgi:cation:H+ antiporter
LATILGIAGSFMGVLAVALVTTMPELSVTWGALRLGSETMALGNVYGSCAFNVLILGIADLMYPKPIFWALDQSHIAAGVGAFLLMGLGPAFLALRTRGKLALSQALAVVMVVGWGGLMYLVLTLA